MWTCKNNCQPGFFYEVTRTACYAYCSFDADDKDIDHAAAEFEMPWPVRSSGTKFLKCPDCEGTNIKWKEGNKK